MKSLVSSLFFILLAPNLFGQTITDIIPQVGQTFLIAHNFSYANTGSAGTGVTWDFSDLDFSNESQVAVMAGADAPSGEMFPGNALALSMTSDGSFINYSFIDFSQNSWIALGNSYSTGSYTVYENPHEMIVLPLTPESSGSDTYEFIEELFVYERVYIGTTEWEVDGSGTLILPNATYENALRVRTQVTELAFWEGEDLQIEIDRTTYHWYANGIPYPLLTLGEETYYDVEDDESFYAEFGQAFIAFNTVSVAELNPKFSPQIFPNPVIEKLNISPSKDFGDTRAYAIYDLSGRKILSENLVVSTEANIEIDVSYLRSGIYFLQLENDTYITTSRFVKR